MLSQRCDVCSSHPSPIDPGFRSGHPQLDAVLEEDRRDARTWNRHLRCRTCGGVWVETNENRGHGEVPVLIRTEPDQ